MVGDTPRLVWTSVAGRGPRLPSIQPAIHDGKRGAGQETDLPDFREPLAQLRDAVATGPAAAGRRGAGGRGWKSAADAAHQLAQITAPPPPRPTPLPPTPPPPGAAPADP